MAAYDYFYTFENFIGYTGDLSSNPTLYFKDNTLYGRITTQHPNPKNVGRAAPKLLEGYSADNKEMFSKSSGASKGVRLYEENTRLGKTHTSRNTLVECVSIGKRAPVRSRVLELIAKNTQVKEKDDEASRAPHEFVPLAPL